MGWLESGQVLEGGGAGIWTSFRGTVELTTGQV